MYKRKLNEFSYDYENPEKPNKVWIYTRVNPVQVKDDVICRINQEKQSKVYATQEGFEVTKTVNGTFVGDKGYFNRREFSILLEELRKSETKPYAVLVCELNRFSRSGGNAIALVSELIKDLGVHIIEVNTGKTSATPSGLVEIYDTLIKTNQTELNETSRLWI
ncbi:MAG: recombinase family protein [Flavobacteriales bacterium]|nr:recombinase family protein [Flavobacteriales bacterium]